MRIAVMYSTHAASAPHLRRMAAMAGVDEVVVADSDDSAAAAVRGAQIVLGHRYLRQSLPFADALQWVQSTAAGVDRLPLQELADMGIALSRMTIASHTIARHAVTLAWSLARCLPQFMREQRDGRWNNDVNWPHWPRRAMVMGLGGIGSEIARILHQDGIEVVGVRSRGEGPVVAGCDRILHGDAFRAELPHVDWLILALPLTSTTRNLIDRIVLGALPAHAIVVNVGRGETLTTGDLCEVLRGGHLGGAGLDVIAPKPTGNDDPIWHTPRLLITPHVASHCQERSEMTERFCEEQMARFVRGEPVRDLVDLACQSRLL